jgi:hypothetical protein
VSALYRVRQFVRAVDSWIRSDDADTTVAARYLPPEAVKLFQAMSRYDRQHALKVVQALERQGHTDRDLMAAALLHDAGKTVTQGGRVWLWHRVAVVLMHVFWPNLLERLAKGGRQGWRRPFFVQLTHAAISAEAAEHAGCSEVTVDLIRRHEDAPGQADGPLLAALQAADSEN